MSVVIAGVEPGSIAGKKEIHAGDILVKVNGHDIHDVLDYRFYMVDICLKMEIKDSKGNKKMILIRKKEYEDPGLNFKSYLMDNKQCCRNKCVFCFIDQLPPGMRDSLYFKDDDARLSFLMGNYITLTNLSKRDVDRIIDMHISPINISVHTTNPELRVKMMRNKNAGAALDILNRLAEAGISMNCQLVMCSGINDGPELKRTLNDLGRLYPAVQSVAAVPVGLTKYRNGLYPLESYDLKSALEIIRQIESFGNDFKIKNGTRLVYPADEFYIKAGRNIPSYDFYEEFSQLENGVGMLAFLTSQFYEALDERSPGPLGTSRQVSLATGRMVYPFIKKMIQSAEKVIANLKCRVYAINNDFFGENVDVSGLVTGTDLIKQLSNKDLGKVLLIPNSMLRREQDLFLDGISLEEAERALKVKVIPVENNGQKLLEALTGE